MSANRPPRIAIVGPTASGKSAVALEVARRVGDAEIVSVDAFGVYRGFDIGTAKPNAVEREQVRHHLIDLVAPSEEFTVADFQREYHRVVSDLDERKVGSVLVGGTGLYLRAVIDDLDLPGQWPEIRADLEARLETEGVGLLYSELEAVDPAASSKIDPHNARRIVRALEVCLGSGRRFSSFGPGLDTYHSTDVVQFGLVWRREMLEERIRVRIGQMIDAGFLDEVRMLRSGPPWSRTAGQAVGYNELVDHLEGRTSLDEAIATIVQRTRRLAVRQERWFRRDPRIRWIEVEQDPLDEAVPVVIELFDRLRS
jgi:tRNA dimethylallyltransferase